MSDTLLREKNQVTLPGEVVQAAGLSPSDRIAWRFEDGEIIGRKLVPEEKKEAPLVKMVRSPEGFLMLPAAGAALAGRDEIRRALRADREAR